MRSDSPYSLPLLYDIAFDFRDIPAEVTALLNIAKQHLRRPVDSVIDLGCGPGRHVLEFAKYCAAHGVDDSPEMITYARQLAKENQSSAEFFVGDIRTWNTPRRYDLAVCLLLTFTHLLTDDDIRQHLRTVSRLLNPGGIYIIETANAGLLESDQPLPPAGLTENSWSSTRGDTTVITTWGESCRHHPTVPDVDELTVTFEITRNLETDRFTFLTSHRRLAVERLQDIVASVPGMNVRALCQSGLMPGNSADLPVSPQPLLVLQLDE